MSRPVRCVLLRPGCSPAGSCDGSLRIQPASYPSRTIRCQAIKQGEFSRNPVQRGSDFSAVRVSSERCLWYAPPMDDPSKSPVARPALPALVAEDLGTAEKVQIGR